MTGKNQEFFNRLCGSQSRLRGPLQAFNTLWVLKTGLLNINRFCGSQNDFIEPLQALNRLCCSQNGFKPLTGFSIVKICMPQALNMLHGSQNMYHGPLLALNRLCDSRNGIGELLQSFNWQVVNAAVKTGRHCSGVNQASHNPL